MTTNDDGRTRAQPMDSLGRDTVQLSRRRMLKGSGVALAALGLIGTTGFGKPDSAQANEKDNVMLERHGSNKPRIVLVHGAWADGTGWQHVIPLLEEDGYTVTAVQNPLTSLADDVATTKRVIDAEAQKGPLIVVGHSYGGAVITGAAAGNPNVKALVYLAAFLRGPHRNPLVPLPECVDLAQLATASACVLMHCRYGHADHLDRPGAQLLAKHHIPVYAQARDRAYLQRRGLRVAPLQIGVRQP